MAAVFEGRARHERTTGYISKTIMPHLALEASPLLAIGHLVALRSVLATVAGAQESRALSAFLVPQERARLLPPLRCCRVLRLADLLSLL